MSAFGRKQTLDLMSQGKYTSNIGAKNNEGEVRRCMPIKSALIAFPDAQPSGLRALTINKLKETLK